MRRYERFSIIIVGVFTFVDLICAVPYPVEEKASLQLKQQVKKKKRLFPFTRFFFFFSRSFVRGIKGRQLAFWTCHQKVMSFPPPHTHEHFFAAALRFLLSPEIG